MDDRRHARPARESASRPPGSARLAAFLLAGVLASPGGTPNQRPPRPITWVIERAPVIVLAAVGEMAVESRRVLHVSEVLAGDIVAGTDILVIDKQAEPEGSVRIQTPTTISRARLYPAGHTVLAFLMATSEPNTYQSVYDNYSVRVVDIEGAATSAQARVTVKELLSLYVGPVHAGATPGTDRTARKAEILVRMAEDGVFAWDALRDLDSNRADNPRHATQVGSGPWDDDCSAGLSRTQLERLIEVLFRSSPSWEAGALAHVLRRYEGSESKTLDLCLAGLLRQWTADVVGSLAVAEVLARRVDDPLVAKAYEKVIAASRVADNDAYLATLRELSEEVRAARR